jgi:hypothetical protein
MPGGGASIITRRVVRSGREAANAKATMLPISWPTTSSWSIFSASSTPATSAACVFLVKPPVGIADNPMPRRSGTTTV